MTLHLRTRERSPRAQWSLEQAGVPPLLARLFAARGVLHKDELDDSLSKLLPPQGLKDIDKAAALLGGAIEQQARLCIVADYDCDGATACAVAVRGLQSLGAQKVDYLVPNRMLDGYGLTAPIAERVKQMGAQVLITVDNGIASVEGVAKAKALGMKVLITDHHLPGEQIPQADAIVNPNQVGCDFQSKNLAGVGVMFYVLMATRAWLRARGAWARDDQREPKLDVLLPLVALGTVADLVKLDANNRRLVAQGLRRIRTGHLPHGMRALFSLTKRRLDEASTSDFGFVLAPRLNAAGRLSDMRLGIACLLSDTAEQAMQLAAQLDQINRERRAIELQMRKQAVQMADSLIIGGDESQGAMEGPCALCVRDASFHEGVIGIVASRLKDLHHRPTFVFAPSQADPDGRMLKGSGRSIAGFHLRDALDWMAKRHPDLIVHFGGHAMAAGCTIEAVQYETFAQAFSQVAKAWLDQAALSQILMTDGSLKREECRIDVIESINREVWGQGFEAPVFCDTVQVVSQRIVGEGHLALKIKHQDVLQEAIWFNRVEPLPASATLAYRLEVEEWQGQRRIKWMVQGAAA